MRKLIAPIVFSLALATSGCTRSTPYGECQGLATEGEKDPKLKYELSTWNIVLAVIFSETALWPVLTGAFWLWCPTGRLVK